MISTFNKNDYIVLEALVGLKCTTPVISLTINDLIKLTNFSHVKVRQSIKSFQMFNYVKEGSKDGNTKTYYITDEGVKHYMSVMNYTDDDILDLIDKYEKEFNDIKEED